MMDDYGKRPESPSSDRLERAITTARLITLALATSVFVYVMVGTLLIQSGAAQADVATYRIPVVSFGFGALVGSIMFRRWSFSPLRLENVHLAKGDEGLVAHLLSSTIVSVALAEAAGVAGLVLGLLTSDAYGMYGMCASALAGILFSLPRANGWREAYHRIVSRGRGSADGFS